MVPSLPHFYTKPYLSVAAQLELLAGRGIEIGDWDAAHDCLERIGYYRLSGYWYPFRKSHISVHPVTGELLPHPLTGKPQMIDEDGFRPRTTFQQIMDLYVFGFRVRPKTMWRRRSI